MDKDAISILLSVFFFVIAVVYKALSADSKKKHQEQEQEDFFAQLSESEDSSSLQEEYMQEFVPSEVNQEQKARVITFDEGVSAMHEATTSAESVSAKIEKPKGESNENLSGIKKRLKENPQDFVVLGEILKPKYKEY